MISLFKSKWRYRVDGAGGEDRKKTLKDKKKTTTYVVLVFGVVLSLFMVISGWIMLSGSEYVKLKIGKTEDIEAEISELAKEISDLRSKNEAEKNSEIAREIISKDARKVDLEALLFNVKNHKYDNIKKSSFKKPVYMMISGGMLFLIIIIGAGVNFALVKRSRDESK